MMYHYFGNKEDLFQQVLEEAYGDFREREAALELDGLDPVGAQDADRVHLELLSGKSGIPHFGEQRKSSQGTAHQESRRDARYEPALRRADAAFARSRRQRRGLFRQGLDPVQVNITIAAIGYYYLTNRFTGSIVFERDLMCEAGAEGPA